MDAAIAVFLTPAEVQTLTGFRQPKRQCEWLTKNGIAFEVPISGHPRIQKDAIDPSWKPRQPAPTEPFIFRPLDRDAVFRPMDEIRSRRVPYTLGRGPEGCGVYFLFLRWAFVYVGKSVDMGARLRAHYMNVLNRRTNVIPFDKFSAIEIPEYWLDEVEAFYITKYRPPFNIKGVRRG